MIKRIKDIWLCIKYPFLWTRNRWTGTHYVNWKLLEYIRENHGKSETSFWIDFVEKCEEEIDKYLFLTPDLDDRKHCVLVVEDGSTLLIEYYENWIRKGRETIPTPFKIKKVGFAKKGHRIIVEVEKFEEEKCPNRFRVMTISKTWKYWLSFLRWIHDWPLQILHCIPDSTELDFMEAGWRKAFGEDLCRDLKKAAKEDGLKPREIRIMQIKEKWGVLEVYLQGYTEKIDQVIRKYRKLSGKTCIVCGKPATKISKGWVSPYCDEHIGDQEYSDIDSEE